MSSDAVSARLVLALARVLYSNGQMTDQVMTAAHRLAAALGLDARIIVRWAGLSLVQTTTGNGAIKRRVLATVKASPKGVNMDRVAAAMGVVAVGFAAVVSMIPGVFLFRMASGLLEIVRGTGDGSALDQTLTNGLASASILLAMSLGLIGAKRIIDLLIDPERFHVSRTVVRMDR